MRLINTRTLELEETHNEIRRYVILSHTWGSTSDEVTFKEMSVATEARSPTTTNKSGYTKIVKTCEIARAIYYLDWVWIDTCCIDKTSSAELSEAINTMFRWYQDAEFCLAYLSDMTEVRESFEKSRWFTRGWTLQELVAPREVKFLDQAWIERGTKATLSNRISRITGIATGVLDHSIDRMDIPVAARMSWASKRVTTRVEDLAYCLLGIFDINMPMLYGEREKAFIRLQEEIVRQSDDLSIFLWIDTSARYEFCGILAPSPACFGSGVSPLLKVSYAQPTNGTGDFYLTNRGMRFSSDLVRQENGHAALNLEHSFARDKSNIGIYLRRIDTGAFARARPTGLCVIHRSAGETLPFSVDGLHDKTQDEKFTVVKSFTPLQSDALSRKALQIQLRFPSGVRLIEAQPPGFWDKERNLLYPVNRGTFVGYIGVEFGHGFKTLSYPIVFCYRDGSWSCKTFQKSDWKALEMSHIRLTGKLPDPPTLPERDSGVWYHVLSRFPDETYILCARHLHGRLGPELSRFEIRGSDDKRDPLTVQSVNERCILPRQRFVESHAV